MLVVRGKLSSRRPSPVDRAPKSVRVLRVVSPGFGARFLGGFLRLRRLHLRQPARLTLLHARLLRGQARVNLPFSAFAFCFTRRFSPVSASAASSRLFFSSAFFSRRLAGSSSSESRSAKRAGWSSPGRPRFDAPASVRPTAFAAGTRLERSRSFMSISSSSTKPSSCAPKMRRFGSYFTLLHPPTLSQSTVSRSTPSASALPPPGTSISASRGPCSAAFLFARRTLLPTLDGFGLRPPPPLPPTKPMATRGSLTSGSSPRPAQGITSEESVRVCFAANAPSASHAVTRRTKARHAPRVVVSRE